MSLFTCVANFSFQWHIFFFLSLFKPMSFLKLYQNLLTTRGGVEDTRLEAKAKDTKKIRGQGQGQPFRGQTLSRPRTGMLEAKDQGHKAQVLSKKKKKKVFTKIFQAISKKKIINKKKKGLHKNFSSDLHEKTLSKKFFNRSTKF